MQCLKIIVKVKEFTRHCRVYWNVK